VGGRRVIGKRRMGPQFVVLLAPRIEATLLAARLATRDIL